jgi:hypothetical protein
MLSFQDIMLINIYSNLGALAVGMGVCCGLIAGILLVSNRH